MKTPIFSCVIHTKDRKEEFQRCLKCIIEQDYIPQELIIVENIINNKYYDLNKIKEIIKEKVRVQYYAVQFRNIAESRNFSIKLCSNTYIVSVDDDVFFEDQKIISKLFKILLNTKGLAVVFGSLIPDRKTTYSEFSALLHSGVRKKKALVNTFPSSYFLLNKRLVTKHRLFFDSTFNTGEDIKFFYELNSKGEKLLFSPSIRAVAYFPNNFFDFLIKQTSYSKYFYEFYTFSNGEIDLISFIFPFSKKELLFYLPYLWSQITNKVKEKRHEFILSYKYIPTIYLYYICVVIGFFSSKKALAYFLHRASHILVNRNKKSSGKN